MQVQKRSAILTEVHRLAGPDGEMQTIGSAPGLYNHMGSFRMSSIEKGFELGK
ncbi:MAG: hypothetical protein ABJ360_27895 [Roseobacter sp.]